MPIWDARCRDLDGQSRSRTCDRKGDAERHLQAVGADLQRGEYTDPGLRRVHFDDWADQFWATAIHVRPSTRRGYRQALEGHLRPAFGTRPIGSIDRADIKRWATEKLESGISSKTIRNWLSVMILVFDEAIDAKALRENPARGVKLPRPQRTEPQFFTAEQIEQLAEAMEPRQYAFLIRFAAYTGLRLPAFLRDQADEHLAWLVEDQGRPLEPDDYVFRSVKGGPLDRQRFREKIMRPALRRAGLPEAFRAHACATRAPR